jgi:hypothetical protein
LTYEGQSISWIYAFEIDTVFREIMIMQVPLRPPRPFA